MQCCPTDAVADDQPVEEDTVPTLLGTVLDETATSLADHAASGADGDGDAVVATATQMQCSSVNILDDNFNGISDILCDLPHSVLADISVLPQVFSTAVWLHIVNC